MAKIYNSEEEKQADLARQAEEAAQANLMHKANLALDENEFQKIRDINTQGWFHNYEDMRNQAKVNINQFSDEDKLKQFYDLNPDLAPKKPVDVTKLDPQFLEQMANLVHKPEPIRSEMPDSQRQIAAAPLEMLDAPMSIGNPASTGAAPMVAPGQTIKKSMSVSGTIPRKSEEASPDQINFGQNLLSTVENLKNAQSRRDDDLDSAETMRLAALLGSSQSGVKNDYLTGAADRLDKRSANNVGDLNDQVAMQKQDPTSSVSKGYRDMMKQFGVNVQGDASATDIEKIAPWIQKAYEGNENRLARSEDMKFKYSVLNAQKDQARQAKEDQTTEKMGIEFGKDLDDTRARAGSLGKNSERWNAADRVETLYNAAGNDPNLISMRELGTSVASLLTSGSQTAVAQINELVPHTASGSAAAIQDWLTGEPHGAGQQKFAKMYLKIAQREKQTIERQMKDAQFKKANTTWSSYKKRNPDDYYQKLSGRTGIDVDEIRELESQPGFSGGYNPTTYSDNDEAGIQRVMEHNGVSRREAIKALKEAKRLK